MPEEQGNGHSHGDVTTRMRGEDESSASENTHGKDQSPLRRTLAAQRGRLRQFKPRTSEGHLQGDRFVFFVCERSHVPSRHMGHSICISRAYEL
jgi:hypothetical protein